MWHCRGMGEVALRDVEDGDRDALFDLMRDARWVHMAAFTAADPDDRDAFDRWLDRQLTDPDVVIQAITSDGRPIGSIAAFPSDGALEVAYGVHPDHWGHGIATRVLRLLLHRVTNRPLYARAAADNAGSLRVLTKVGFRPVRTEHSYAPGRRSEIDETILRLDR